MADYTIFLFYVSLYLSWFILSIVFYTRLKHVLILTSVFIFFIALNILLKQDFMKSKTVLFVEVFHVSDSIPNSKFTHDLRFYIDFKENNKCIVQKGFVDFSYFYPYDYSVSNDTISITGDIIEESDSVLTTKYLLDKKDQMIRPITISSNKIPCLKIIEK